MLTGLRPARRKSLPDDIVEELLRQIAGSDTPRYRLPPERTLCEQLGVGRASLREALSRLLHLGVVETRGKAKFGIAARAHAELIADRPRSDDVERSLVTHPLEARRMLEPSVAATAARRATDADLAELRQWIARMNETVDSPEDLVEYDAAFHVAIARATGNDTLVLLIRALTTALRESRLRSFLAPEATAHAIGDHRAIVTAIEARDTVAARRAMRAHLDAVEGLLRETIEG
jgi:GntR family transcriptional regulator, transcriptional repressor for pyruvate dehydrogenase complex